MPNPFDTLALPIERTSKLMLLHPVTWEALTDVDGNQGWIELLSIDSEEAQMHRIGADDAQRRLGRLFNAKEELDSFSEQYAKLTKSWHLVGLDGAKLAVPCTYDLAVQLYSNTATRWIRTQVQVHIGNRGNFFPLAGLTTSEHGAGINGGSTNPSSEGTPAEKSTSEPKLPLGDEA